MIGCKARNKIGIFNRFEKTGKLSVGLTHKTKELHQLKNDNHESEYSRENHIFVSEHVYKQAHAQSDQDYTQNDAGTKVAEYVIHRL